jgi:regulator of replication initiation timing
MPKNFTSFAKRSKPPPVDCSLVLLRKEIAAALDSELVRWIPPPKPQEKLLSLKETNRLLGSAIGYLKGQVIDLRIRFKSSSNRIGELLRKLQDNRTDTEVLLRERVQELIAKNSLLKEENTYLKSLLGSRDQEIEKLEASAASARDRSQEHTSRLRKEIENIRSALQFQELGLGVGAEDIIHDITDEEEEIN